VAFVLSAFSSPGKKPRKAPQKMADNTDSKLVLFPGSRENPEAVALLSTVGVFDDYMIRNRLRTRLPVIFGPCRRASIAGETGKKLADAGVRFMAVSTAVLEAPFFCFDAVRCRFDPESVRIWDENGDPQTLFHRDRFLVVEAVYDSTRKQVAEAPGKKARGRSLGLDFRPDSQTTSGPGGENAGVIFLFSKGRDAPVRFMEEAVDFSFLEGRRSLVAAENFRLLGSMLSERFGPVCRDMVRFSFAIPVVTEELPEISEQRGKRKRQIQVRSNVSSVNTLARLFYGRWWQENGWADRVFPP
jgi:hypothetical protein